MKEKSIIKRLGLSEIIFIIGLVISSFVLINTIDITSKIEKENQSINNYSESIQYRLKYNGKEKPSQDEIYTLVNNIINCLENLDCNTSICKVGVCVNNQIDDMFPEIVINTNDDYKLQLTDTNTSNSNDYQLVVGESVIELSEDHVGKSLNIAGIDVPIQGVYKNNNAAGIDYSITFMYNECGKDLKQYLNNQICNTFSSFSIVVKLYSDNSIDTAKSKFTTEMKNFSVDCQTYKQQYGGSDYQNYWYRFYNKIFITVCLVFSLFTCFSLSFLWISSRRKEMAIRKAFGYNNFVIFELLIKDIVKLSIPAIIASMALEAVYCLVFGNLSFFDKYFIIKFCGIFIGTILIGVLCAINLMSEVSKITPVSVIREEK
ncbi:hypothetical protein RASY3_02760 [Ruminococcus albus SY3]|uniref:ABC3 transporter permease C-terminal domain-containing protein n=1 Tax=Ruminococcus albus SY3 TaxID=1341156 RepID=A0A011W2K2_RUMAL|nr:FtsX-like permease family protein [Ruminococcus albus]EXM41018.1 hypothetical protein RASY3_02760 [Ruminococcus albus SY3]